MLLLCVCVGGKSWRNLTLNKAKSHGLPHSVAVAVLGGECLEAGAGCIEELRPWAVLTCPPACLGREGSGTPGVYTLISYL